MQKKILLLSAVTLLLLSSRASAQEITQDGAVVVYGSEFFTRYNAVNGLDVVSQIPGFNFQDVQGGRRGLSGGFSNVLIDGERPSTKDGGLTELLERIPLSSIVRVELIREQVPEIDMRGQSRVLNIVLNRAINHPIFSYNVSAAHFSRSNDVVPSGQISTTFQLGENEITIGAEGSRNRLEVFVDETRFFPSGDTPLLTGELSESATDRGIFNFNLARPIGSSGALNLSSRLELRDWNRVDAAEITDFAQNPTGARLLQSDGDRTQYQVGADYEHILSETLSWKLIGLTSRTDQNQSSRRDSFGADLSFISGSLVEDTFEEGEDILRTTLNWQPADLHSFEFGYEQAFNFFDGAFYIYSDDGQSVTPVALPINESRVEEVRNEISFNYVWTGLPDWTFESDLRAEFSTITQSGDAEKSRRFEYYKPGFSASWHASERDQFQFSIRRDVGQLSFSRFTSEVDLVDGETDISNTELVPYKTWIFSAIWERRFGEEGSITAALTHEMREDQEDVIPLRDSDGNIFDSPGNIGDAEITFLEIGASLPLDQIGLNNAIFEPTIFFRQSSVTDPLTFEERRLSGFETWRFAFDFRQDSPENGWAWGARYFVSGEEFSYRSNQLTQWVPTADMDIFIETSRLPFGTLRFTYENVLDGDSERVREFYATSRDALDVVLTERQFRDFGQTLRLELRGSF